MPSVSKKQQRFFGMVHAYQKGELKDASPSVKKAAKSISYDDVEHFASTKHKELPEKVRKKKKKSKKVYEIKKFDFLFKNEKIRLFHKELENEGKPTKKVKKKLKKINEIVLFSKFIKN